MIIPSPEDLSARNTLDGDDAGLLTERTNALDDADRSVVLALNTSDCFSFFREVADRRRLKTRNAMVYDIEEFIPLDADDLAVGVLDSAGGSLIIAADSRSLVTLVRTIESRGGYIASITPIILLAIGALAKAHALKKWDALIWESDEGFDLVRLCNGKPIGWHWCSDQDALKESFHSLVGSKDAGRVALVHCGEDLGNVIGKVEHVDAIEMDRQQAAADECSRVVAGRSTPLVDLRDGPLRSASPYRPIRTSLRMAMAAAFVFQVVVLASAWVARERYASQTEASVLSQELNFKTVFPGEPIPVGMVARLESERRRLAGTRGVSEKALPAVRSALPVMHVFLSGMPEIDSAKFNIDRLEFSAGSIQNLSGEAKSYQDLEYLAERLRNAGLAVPPVSATATTNGVSLRFDEILRAENGAKSP